MNPCGANTKSIFWPVSHDQYRQGMMSTLLMSAHEDHPSSETHPSAKTIGLGGTNVRPRVCSTWTSYVGIKISVLHTYPAARSGGKGHSFKKSYIALSRLYYSLAPTDYTSSCFRNDFSRPHAFLQNHVLLLSPHPYFTQYWTATTTTDTYPAFLVSKPH